MILKCTDSYYHNCTVARIILRNFRYFRYRCKRQLFEVFEICPRIYFTRICTCAVWNCGYGGCASCCCQSAHFKYPWNSIELYLCTIEDSTSDSATEDLPDRRTIIEQVAHSVAVSSAYMSIKPFTTLAVNLYIHLTRIFQIRASPNSEVTMRFCVSLYE